MICHIDITKSLMNLSSCVAYLDGYLVGSHCLYPTHRVVKLFVRQNPQGSFFVSDYGLAYEEMDALNIDTSKIGSICKNVANKYGVEWCNTEFHYLADNQEELEYALVAVANAAKDAVMLTMSKIRHHVHEDFREILKAYFKEHHADLIIKEKMKVVGTSNHQYAFDLALRNTEDKIILIKPVLSDISSVNNAIVSSLDIAREEGEYQQANIYDANAQWDASLLLMLKQFSEIVSSNDNVAMKAALKL